MSAVTPEILNAAIETAREYGATELIVFGSALDPSQEPGDLDVACRGIHGWKFFSFGAALEDRLDMPVDVVPLDEPNDFTRLIERDGRRLL